MTTPCGCVASSGIEVVVFLPSVSCFRPDQCELWNQDDGSLQDILETIGDVESCMKGLMQLNQRLTHVKNTLFVLIDLMNQEAERDGTIRW